LVRNPVFTTSASTVWAPFPSIEKIKKVKPLSCAPLCLRIYPDLADFVSRRYTLQGRYINEFKRGVSLFAIRTDSPILFLYLEGNNALWPKGRLIPFPGTLKVHIGPVHPPAPIEDIYEAYREWVTQINPNAYRPGDMPDPEEDYPEIMPLRTLKTSRISR